MRKSILFLLILFSGYISFAQQGILFTNKVTQKEIMIKSGDYVKLSYKGYIGQKEIKTGVVYSIQDSIIEILAPVSTGRFSAGGNELRYIYIKDLTGFRKFRKSRPYLIVLSSVAITAGSILLYYAIDRETNLNFGQKLGLSIGTGVISSLVVKGLFPERIKNKIGENWDAKVLK